MYKLLLISKYLRRKLAPLFAALAVLLCTAMVIIVMSVMGGFLELLRDAAHRLTGDVIVWAGGLNTFPHYEELGQRIEALPQVAVATPTVRTAGLVRIADSTELVEVYGIVPPEYDKVVSYRDAIHWSTTDLLVDFERRHGELAQLDPVLRGMYQRMESLDLVGYAMTLDPPEWRKLRSDRPDLPGAVIGVEVNPWKMRGPMGQYDINAAAIAEDMVLTVLPLSQAGGTLKPADRVFAIVNEFKSGLYDVDAQRVYVPLRVLQEMLNIQEAPEYDEDFEPTGRVISGRISELMIKAAPGVSVDDARDAVAQVVRQFREERRGELPMMEAITWEQRHQTLLNAVQNERGMITFLFAVISIVAVVMVATTFYMIVLEKTRDIGTLRAIGASRFGIAGIFLGYGLAIGIVGSLLGVALAWGVVTNLNGIQELLATWFGWRMWNPETYYFDRIPDQVDVPGAIAVAIGAVISSVAGALIPALLAARLNPVEALRYE